MILSKVNYRPLRRLDGSLTRRSTKEASRITSAGVFRRWKPADRLCRQRSSTQNPVPFWQRSPNTTSGCFDTPIRSKATADVRRTFHIRGCLMVLHHVAHRCPDQCSRARIAGDCSPESKSRQAAKMRFPIPGKVSRGVNRRIHLYRRCFAAVGSAVGLAFGTAVPGHTEPPGDAAASPFPDMAHITAWYRQLQPEEFFTPDHQPLVGDTTGQQYVWFLSPSGLNCGIWFWGSFGCAGDIPGAPPGDNHIAWYNGNRAVNDGWTAAIQFPPGQAQRTLPPRSYVTYNSTTCAITPDGSIYCGHGEFKFLVTQTETWFKGWDDRRSYVCNAYGSCPPG